MVWIKYIKKPCTLFIILFILFILFISSISIEVSKKEYICENKDMTMRCAKLSATNITCYPNYKDYNHAKRCKPFWQLSNNTHAKTS